MDDITADVDPDGFDDPMFRPLRHDVQQRSARWHLNRDAINHIVKKCIRRGYSPHESASFFASY